MIFLKYFISIFILIIGVKYSFGCDQKEGPEGKVECILLSPYFSTYQYATCLRNNYIQIKSNNRHFCSQINDTFCYYNCMLEKHDIDKGKVYDDCFCMPIEKTILSDLFNMTTSIEKTIIGDLFNMTTSGVVTVKNKKTINSISILFSFIVLLLK